MERYRLNKSASVVGEFEVQDAPDNAGTGLVYYGSQVVGYLSKRAGKLIGHLDNRSALGMLRDGVLNAIHFTGQDAQLTDRVIGGAVPILANLLHPSSLSPLFRIGSCTAKSSADYRML